MSERGAGASRQATEGDLPDVNVWLALAIEEHPHHRPAVAYWGKHAATARFFCRTGAMSLVRLLTHPRLMADKPLALTDAWAVYCRFAVLPGVAMLSEPPSLDADLGALVTPNLPPRLFTDAYFAALARSAGLRLVTFDSDFERFGGLRLLRLTVKEGSAAR